MNPVIASLQEPLPLLLQLIVLMALTTTAMTTPLFPLVEWCRRPTTLASVSAGSRA